MESFCRWGCTPRYWALYIVTNAAQLTFSANWFVSVNSFQNLCNLSSLNLILIANIVTTSVALVTSSNKKT